MGKLLISDWFCLTTVSQEFAGEGLRTLVVAYKNLDEDYFQDWIRRHHEASTALEGREDKLSELYEEIEKDLMVGVSGKLGQALGEAVRAVVCQ